MNKKMPPHQVFPLRIPCVMHKELRKLAYLTEVPMAELIREGILLKLNENRKVLTNSDIAI